MTFDFGSAEASILWPAFAAGLLVTATHVPLGMQVLARGIVFIDLPTGPVIVWVLVALALLWHAAIARKGGMVNGQG